MIALLAIFAACCVARPYFPLWQVLCTASALVSIWVGRNALSSYFVARQSGTYVDSARLATYVGLAVTLCAVPTFTAEAGWISTHTADLGTTASIASLVGGGILGYFWPVKYDWRRWFLVQVVRALAGLHPNPAGVHTTYLRGGRRSGDGTDKGVNHERAPWE